jgi:hypothetical protein
VRGTASPGAPDRRWFQGGRPDLPLARWLRLTTPGTLISRSAVILALILAPSFTLLVHVDKPVRFVAAVLLFVHVVAGVFVLRSSCPRLAIAVAGALLCVDAVLSGVMLGADGRMSSPPVAIGMVVLAIGFQTGGWRALCVCSIGLGLGVAVAIWSDMGAPFVFSPALSYSTALNVETSFAGTRALARPVYHFSTRLKVDTSFAGGPAIGQSARLFVPALVLACIALCAGNGVTLLRVGRERHRMERDRERTR